MADADAVVEYALVGAGLLFLVNSHAVLQGLILPESMPTFNWDENYLPEGFVNA